ncbi:hypothetical protein ABZ490_22805 [Streptomyces sp. NPDC005811]|uniref:hypothetical protein n=1 Tax=Streptomyces sp. NPDC005811 TaxID=3154565 RepID=UPI0033EDD0B8
MGSVTRLAQTIVDGQRAEIDLTADMLQARGAADRRPGITDGRLGSSSSFFESARGAGPSAWRRW